MIIINQEGLAAFNSDFISAYIKGDPKGEMPPIWQIVAVEAGEKARVLATYDSREQRDAEFDQLLEALDRSRDIDYQFTMRFAPNRKHEE